MSGAIVTIEGGKIRVVPSFGDLVVCGRLGGRYVPAARAWVFAATEQNARRLRAALRRLQATPEFEMLISGAQPLAMSEPPPPSAEATGASANTLALVAIVPEEPTLVAPPASVAVVAEPEFVLPDGILTRPWRHQVAALRFALERFALGLHGVLLAMGMGTGKTLVALIILMCLRALLVMISCPLRVVSVWVGEIERHIGARVVVVALDEDGGTVEQKMELAAAKMKLAAAMGVPCIVVINYDSAWRDPFAAWAEKQQWDLVIADEAHRLKASGGKASMFFKRIRKCANYRLALTGTPMPHSPLDIHPVFRFLDVTIFGPAFGPFRSRFAVMGGYQSKQVAGYQHLDELERLMSRITFRVGSEVLDLPPATHVTYHCDLCPEARRVYTGIEEDFVAEVQDGRVTATNALVKLIRLQQIANGVLKTDDGNQLRIDDAKRRLLTDTLEDMGKDEPVVVFCRYHLDLDAVHEACRAVGFESLELSGRQDDLARWQKGDGQVLAVQTSAGGVGVDLTRARFSIYYSLGFSLGDYEQSEKRIHRPGQTRPVEYIHLVARNTVDVKIMRALARRAAIVESILAEITN